MKQESSDDDLTLALNTALERDFVSPLTSIRGALEIMRDYPDLSPQERNRFLGNALSDCSRLELGIEQLASTVHATGDQQREQPAQAEADAPGARYSRRIHLDAHSNIVEVDLSDFVFKSAEVVNEFHNQLDHMIEQTGHRWFILVNYRNCSIWPEAWFAFAHRGKKVNVSYSLGTVRYVETGDGEENTLLNDPDLFASRAEALEHIEELREAQSQH